jgi:hypothetical protein
MALKRSISRSFSVFYLQIYGPLKVILSIKKKKKKKRKERNTSSIRRNYDFLSAVVYYARVKMCANRGHIKYINLPLFYYLTHIRMRWLIKKCSIKIDWTMRLGNAVKLNSVGRPPRDRMNVDVRLHLTAFWYIFRKNVDHKKIFNYAEL